MSQFSSSVCIVSYRIVSYGITHYHTQCRDEAVNVVVARWCRCTKVCIIIGPCENSRGLTAISVFLYCSDSYCVCCIAVQQQLDAKEFVSVTGHSSESDMRSFREQLSQNTGFNRTYVRGHRFNLMLNSVIIQDLSVAIPSRCSRHGYEPRKLQSAFTAHTLTPPPAVLGRCVSVYCSLG